MMKILTNTTKITMAILLMGVLILPTSCKKELLDLTPTDLLASENFWKTDEDATIALMAAYASARAVFDRDYYFDGQTGEFTRVRGNSGTSGQILRGDAYQAGSYGPSGYGASFDKYFSYLYGSVNRSNYVIENITNKMLPTATGAKLASLESIIAEARLLRGMTYFRLISMWGDVPYISKIIYDNSEVTALARMPIGQVKDSIMADFNYAVAKLPNKAAALGRSGKPAALAFRGKLNLYWGSWKKNGWPELEGFTQNAGEATTAFAAAAADFKSVINDFGLTLYKNGDPGQIDALGKADILPNYFELFTPKANGNPEMLMVFTHSGTPTNPSQGEELMRDFSGRTIEGSQCWIAPRYEIANRYQLTTTGDFAPKLVQLNPTTNAAARTTLNSAVNPNSYANRDYRMKSTIMWDYEMCIGLTSLKSTGFSPYIYNTWAANVTLGGVNYITYNTDGTNSGYVFRKFVRNYEGLGRSEGDYAYPVMRLADVYLMYAEAVLRGGSGGDLTTALQYVNALRARAYNGAQGNVTLLNLDLIIKERGRELYWECHRRTDLIRFKQFTGTSYVWAWKGGTKAGAGVSDNMKLFPIPSSDIVANPNLVQNPGY